MAEQKARDINFRYEDVPELTETFSDAIGQWHFDGHNLRIEFLVSRFDEPRPGEPTSGRRRPACRLVLSTNGVLDLINRAQQLAAVMEKAGLVKKEPPAAKPPAN